jgi:hypothetical protein
LKTWSAGENTVDGVILLGINYTPVSVYTLQASTMVSFMHDMRDLAAEIGMALVRFCMTGEHPIAMGNPRLS